MAFSANDIKNLALTELNHEQIADWTDTSNTDIPLINTQYALAKPVALSMYQWSWAFRYANLQCFEYYFNMPADWKVGTAITVYTDSTKTTEITDYAHYTDGVVLYANAESIYLVYTDTDDNPAETALTGVLNSTTVGKYKYVALLPEDFLGYLAAFTDDNMHVLANYLNVGNQIHTNSKTLYIKYIANVDESVFTPEFVDWFKIFLAQRINGYLNGDMQRQQLLTGEEPFFFRKAKNIDSKRNKHESLDGNPMLWIRGRLGGGGI